MNRIKLTFHQRAVLRAILRDEPIKRSINALDAAGHCARLGLIRPNADRTVWMLTDLGQQVAASEKLS
jgi:hypothetical protein